MRSLLVTAATALVTAVAWAQSPALPEPFPGLLHEHPAIAYESRVAADPVARLMGRARAVPLSYDVSRGYLASVLAALDVPIESQLMLFSKTGIQQGYTNPSNPRALYFNDAVVVGHIPGAPVMEIASLDPEWGAIFYTLRQDPAAPPAFTRREECLRCHISTHTMEVPGFIVRSMFAGEDGHSFPQLGSSLIDHRSPFSQRWAGWFVTGAPATMSHRGNLFARDATVAPDAGPSMRRVVPERVRTTQYLSPFSDVTALMVFDHQMRAANLLTRLAWETRAQRTPDFSTGALADLVSEVSDYLLFVDEAPLEGPITGGSGFAETFATRGPWDTRGRSLRELDRRSRLFRYPCSYMIYSPAVAALPEAARVALFGRMREVLEGRVPGPRYTRLTEADRRAVLEILRATIDTW